MDYHKIAVFEGDSQKAVEVARNLFIQHNFRIKSSGDTAIEADGPGTFWTKGQNPMVGISKINVSTSGGQISVEAEFGGVRKTQLYTAFFICGMAIFFLILFGFLFSSQQMPGRKLFVIILSTFAPWVVLLPLMTKFMKSRSAKAIDAMINNMIVLGS